MSKLTKIAAYASAIIIFAVSATAVAAGNPAAGKEKSALCQGCHGENGMSAAPTFPHLAGQYAAHIKKQVVDYQARLRRDDMMEGMADAVTDKQDLDDIAAYFASQKMMHSDNPTDSLPGKYLYMNGNPATNQYGCINCHGDNGKGKSPNNPVFPVIGGQYKDYLVKQLNEFRSGKRSNDPAGMMADIAKKMTDAEIDAVSEYLSGL